MYLPNNNCPTQAGTVVPQGLFLDDLEHQNVQTLIALHASTAHISLSGQAVIMVGTNAVSCGVHSIHTVPLGLSAHNACLILWGFSGVSESFAAALWGVGYGLKISTVFSNIVVAQTRAVPHKSSSCSSTTGIGSARVMLSTKMALLPSPALCLSTTFQPTFKLPWVDQNGLQSHIVFPYSTLSPHQLFNPSFLGIFLYDRAGRTMGQQYAPDGCSFRNPEVQTIRSNTNTQICDIPAPSPNVALVFLTNEAFTNSGGTSGDAPGSTLTSATTITNGKVHTMIDETPLATSNVRS